MIAEASAEGWGSMGTLPTHFYEYNSMDKDGNPIDLSTRKNSPTSTNTYTPILSEEEAARLTVRNVLCGNDSWDPASATLQCAAPESAAISGTTLTWSAVANASGYAVFRNGEYLAHTSATSYDLNANDGASYTVRAANAHGGLGAASEAVTGGTSGIDAVIGETQAVSAVYYNLQGVQVDADTKGTVIRVEILPDGTRRSEKMIK